jgi:hypothetical protein
VEGSLTDPCRSPPRVVPNACKDGKKLLENWEIELGELLA